MPAPCGDWRTGRRDFGAVLAGGIEVSLGRWRLTAELRHTAGRDNIASGYAPLSTYNEAWSLLVGSAIRI